MPVVPAPGPKPDARPDGEAEVLADFTSIFQRIHLPCWIFDDEGVFVWVNDAFVSEFGDRRGEHFSAVIAPESLEAAGRHFAHMRQDDPAAELELDMLRADGKRVHTEISSVLLEGVGLCCGAFGLTGTLARARPATRTDLTPRQLEVLTLLSGGASTDQIAEELHVTRTTVRNHVNRILQVLGVHSRLAAVAKAHREGLISE
jgi:PAS domain S-box-containing protein